MTEMEKKFWMLRNLRREKLDTYLRKKTQSALEESNDASQEYAIFCEVLIEIMLDIEPNLFDKIFK